MDIKISDLVSKHCSCKGSDNKIIIETVSVCPECFVFYSQVIAQIPPDRMAEVMERLLAVIKEMGLHQKVEPAIITVRHEKGKPENLM